jgi:hypothetical protein
MKAPNGAVYVVVTGASTTYRVYKCADPDSGSFSEQDGSNRWSGIQSWGIACQYEHLIFMASTEVGTLTDWRLKTFNTATDSWVSGTQTIYAGGENQQNQPVSLVATPNYLYALHMSDQEKVHGTNYYRCMVSYRDLDVSLAVNESENAVAFYTGTVAVNDLAAKPWDRSSWGTGVTVGGAGEDPTPLRQAVSYMDGSTNRIIARFQADTGGEAGYEKVFRITSTGTTATKIGAGEVATASEAGTGTRGGLARWGTTLYAWVNNSSENPAYADSTDHGATWGAPTQHSNPSNNLTEHPWANCYTRNGQLKIAIVYKEGTTQLSYDERSITNVTAPAFGSARTPVRQNRIFVDA